MAGKGERDGKEKSDNAVKKGGNRKNGYLCKKTFRINT